MTSKGKQKRSSLGPGTDAKPVRTMTSLPSSYSSPLFVPLYRLGNQSDKKYLYSLVEGEATCSSDMASQAALTRSSPTDKGLLGH